MTVVERKGNNGVLRVTMLGGVFAIVACGAAADAKTSTPQSLACRSDRSSNQLSYAYLPLPKGFKGLTATMSRPRMGEGLYHLRVVVVDSHDPPEHVTGLVSQPLPPLPPGRPLIGYALRLTDGPNAVNPTRKAQYGTLVVPNEFQLSLALAPNSKVTTRISQTANGKTYPDELAAVEIDHSDYTRLAVGCWNGDFELSNIRFETR